MLMEMVGDNEELKELAEKLAETYELTDLLDICDITVQDCIYFLLCNGLIPEDIPHNV